MRLLVGLTAGVIVTNFLVAVEATVVSTAAPAIVADLGNLALYLAAWWMIPAGSAQSLQRKEP